MTRLRPGQRNRHDPGKKCTKKIKKQPQRTENLRVKIGQGKEVRGMGQGEENNAFDGRKLRFRESKSISDKPSNEPVKVIAQCFR